MSKNKKIPDILFSRFFVASLLARLLRITILFVFTCVSLVLAVHLARAADDFTPVTASKNFYVDPYTGSANFSIPVYMPPARKGLPQKLNLVYSSRQQNGWLGVGWKLDLAVIERSTKNGYPVYSSSDKFIFSLGGQQNDLVFVGGKEYRAKTADIAWKFIFDGNYWTVKDNLGNTYYFGLDNYLGDSSRTKDPSSAGKVFRWRLSKITDISGNNIIYKYSSDKIEIYYSEKNEAAKASYKAQDYNYLVSINFSSDRKDRFSNFRPGFGDNYPFDGAGRINEIKVLYRDQLVRRYALEYAYSAITGRSILNKITEFGSDNQSANPPIKFSYSTSACEYETVKYITSINNTIAFIPWHIRYADGAIPPQGNFKLVPEGFLDEYGRVIPVGWSKIYNSETGNSGGFLWSVKPSQVVGTQGNYKNNGNLHIEGKQGQIFHAWAYLTVYTASDTYMQSYTIPSSNTCNGYFFLSSEDHQYGPYQLSQPVNLLSFAKNKHVTFRLDIIGYNFSNNYSMDYNIADIPALRNMMAPAGTIIQPMLSGDFNGDGNTDLGDFTDAASYITIATSNKRDFQRNRPWSVNELHIFAKDAAILGDFNGDGKTDIASDVNSEVNVMLSEGDTFAKKALWFNTKVGAPLTGININNGMPVIGDFNGDGLTDFCYFDYFVSGSDLYARAAFSNGKSLQLQSWFKFSSLYFKGSDQMVSGDFNGDGITDFAFWNKDKKTLEIRGYNNSWSASVVIDDPRVVSSDFKLVFSQDFNFDGKADLFFYNLKEPSFYIMNLFDAGAKSAIKLNLDLAAGYTGGVFSNPLQLGDFNGDGITDFLIFDQMSGTQVAYSTRGDVPDLLTGVDNGWGANMQCKYRPSTDYDYLDLGFTPKFPLSIPLISEVITSDGLGTSYKTRYLYSKGYYDAASREFRGFGYVAKSDDEGNLTETTFLQDDIFKGKIAEQQVSDKNRNLYHKIVNSWGKTSPYADTYIVSLAESNQYSFDGDASYKQKKAVFQYDTYGNQTLAKEWPGSAGSGDQRQVITEFTYNTTNWLISYPSHSYIQDQAGNKFQEKWFYYDTKGHLTKDESQIYNPLTKQSVKAANQYAYDAFGNPTRITDALGRVTTTEYDVDLKTYPAKVTNSLGHVIQYVYDPRLSQVLSVTDANKQVKKYTYDALGRLVKVVGPLDTDSSPAVTYQYDLSVVPNKVVKQVKTSYAAGQPNYLSTYSFYDGLGRLIQTKTSAENDPQSGAARQVVADVVKYNAQSKVVEKYLPYFSAASGAYDQNYLGKPKFSFSYDCLQRLAQTTNPDGTYNQSSYSDWVTNFIDENGHRAAHTQDALARVIKVEEYNGSQTYTTTYKYDALNNLSEVIDNANNHTYFTYDSIGRKIQLSDPDMGTWNYEYDLVGNMTKQTDAKEQVITFTYDTLNRLTAKRGLTPQGVDPVLLAAYLYDDTAKSNSIGRLSKVTDTAGTEEYFYDNLGRQIKSIKTVDGAAFTIQRQYDAIDRLTRLTYPDGEAVNYFHNPQGAAKITGARTYMTAAHYSASGQINRMDYGNTAATDYTYDSYTLRLKRIATQSSKGKVQDLNYTFDNTGNITNIQDNVNTNSQSFLYDDLNRLVKAQGSYGTYTYSYDPLGNILHKEGVNYSYASAKPHAVTATSDGTSYEYDANGNLTRKVGPADTQRFFYDSQNRLIKVSKDATQGGNKTMQVYLAYGVNYISLPFGSSQQVKDVLSSIQSSREEVAYWDAGQNKCLYNVNDPNYDQFSSMDYSRGYWIYIDNPKGVTLTISGITPETYQSNLKTGWNAIGCPKDTETSVEEALRPLQLGADYTSVMRYNPTNGSWQEYSASKKEFVKMKPAEGYWLKASKDKAWNIINLPTGIALGEFSYDASGSRVKKISSGKTTVYVGFLYEKDSDGTTRKHIFLGSTRIATVSSPASPQAGEAIYYHPDHLGSSNVITDATGAKVQLAEYKPFGSLNRNDVIASPEGAKQSLANYLYTGKELDPATNLYYYGARYYNPVIAKFIQPDPLIQDVYDPQTLNHYAYCRNNPLILTDPDGTTWGSTFSSWGSSIYSGISSGLSSIGSWTSNTWNNFTNWGTSVMGSAMNSLDRALNSMQRSLNSMATQTMNTFTSIGSGISSFGQSAWGEVKIYGSALGMGMGYGAGQIGGGIVWAGNEWANAQRDMMINDMEMRNLANQQILSGIKYGHNNLCNNGYVDIGANMGIGNKYGATFGVKIASSGAYWYYGLGEGIGFGAAATYNVGNMPSTGIAFGGSASGGKIVGFKYKVSYSRTGQSQTFGGGVGVGFGANIAMIHTVKIFPKVEF